MKQSLISAIWHYLFGYKYYIVISKKNGTKDYGAHSKLCTTKEEAENLLEDVASYQFVGIGTFRSRKPIASSGTY